MASTRGKPKRSRRRTGGRTLETPGVAEVVAEAVGRAVGVSQPVVVAQSAPEPAPGVAPAAPEAVEAAGGAGVSAGKPDAEVPADGVQAAGEPVEAAPRKRKGSSAQHRGRDNLKGYKWKPGESGNPLGRQGKEQKSFAEQWRHLLDGDGGKLRKAMAQRAFTRAADGDFRFFKEIVDRVDGPIVLKIEFDSLLRDVLDAAARVLQPGQYARLLRALDASAAAHEANPTGPTVVDP